MKLKNILLGSALLSSILLAGGDIVPVEPIVDEIPVSQNAWESSASIYFWGAGISGETALNGDIDIPLSTIIDNFKMGFMGNIRTEKENWGIESDIIYMGLGNYIEDHRFIDTFDFKAWIITPVIT